MRGLISSLETVEWNVYVIFLFNVVLIIMEVNNGFFLQVRWSL